MSEHAGSGAPDLAEDSRMRDVVAVGTVCGAGSCPTIYRTDRGTIVVQGHSVAAAGVEPATGETLVEIPVELLFQAAEELRRRGD